MTTPRTLPFAAAVLALAVFGCSPPPPRGHQHGARTTSAPPVLFDDLGTHHQAITTASPRAQQYFDQGLRLVYGFNHFEAQRAFQESARLDPGCAMCYWGIALTYGSNYNSPTDAERERGAWRAVQNARALGAGATPRERAVIDALAARHSDSPDADRATLDRAYADAMREVTRRFPDDMDSATLYADALMNLHPWRLWTADGRAQPGTEEIVRTLERVLAVAPNHPGANHLYIHAVEASPDPQRAAAAADRIAALMPGAGHIVHMPSHIYIRVGRYADSVAINHRAVAADRAYFSKSEPSEIYRMMYYPHNLDFVWISASMEGRAAETIRAARELAAAAPLDMVRKMPDMEIAPVAPLVALARFGRWQEVLQQPAPDATLPYLTGAWHYTRGLAFNATARPADAARELAMLRRVASGVSEDRTVAGFFKTRDMLALATAVLAGEIAARAGAYTDAVTQLTEAVRVQDEHWFTEPPPWYYPVRQSLGAVLLQAGRPAEAETAYREDLRRNPDNGWSLFGLAQAQRAQNRPGDAAATDARFRRAWSRADVTLSASRF
jgi:tetratricopeptide (TPR) repeat protein